MNELVATALGLDLSTTGLAMSVRSSEGRNSSASVPIQGDTRWNGQPAFLLDYLPELIFNTLGELRSQGWTIRPRAGALSFSVRQHDMVLIGRNGSPLIPALSWQCDAANEEVAVLRKAGAEATVGRIEARFILPKLIWALAHAPNLKGLVQSVMTTGDYLAWQLTGQLRMSTSDALSNALLDQNDKKLAAAVIQQADLSPEWFPPVIQSGDLVGLVSPTRHHPDAWFPIRSLLAGWSVAAGLGDNHASAVGCGLADTKTIVISAGSSGTVCRLCRPSAPLQGEAVCFEYYHDRLLLMMLADCAVWYNRFLESSVDDFDYDGFNQAALTADARKILRVTQSDQGGRRTEVYPDGWMKLGWPEKVASTQFSIALELLMRVRLMLREVKGSDTPIQRFVITGGMARSPFLQGVLQEGLQMLSEPGEPTVMINAAGSESGDFKAAAYGAMMNAMLKGRYEKLGELTERLCPLQSCHALDPDRRTNIRSLLKSLLQ